MQLMPSDSLIIYSNEYALSKKKVCRHVVSCSLLQSEANLTHFNGQYLMHSS